MNINRLKNFIFHIIIFYTSITALTGCASSRSVLIELPVEPEIEIISPNNTSIVSGKMVNLLLSIRSRTSISSLEIFVDGEPAIPKKWNCFQNISNKYEQNNQNKSQKNHDSVKTQHSSLLITDDSLIDNIALITVPIPKEDIFVTVVAGNVNGLGVPATLHLKWRKNRNTKNFFCHNESIKTKQIQSLLLNIGYNPGPIDGIYGPKTRRAILKFQNETNLPKSGKPSEYLLEILHYLVNGKLNDQQTLVKSHTIIPPEQLGEQTTIKPNLKLLAIGTSNYYNKDLRLNYPSKDARDFAKLMSKQEGKLYNRVHPKLLEDPKRDTILSEMEWLKNDTAKRDVTFVFFAGHGLTDRNNNYYYLPAEGDPKNLKDTGISYNEIKETLTTIPGKVVAFIDTCHSGGVLGQRTRGIKPDIENLSKDLTNAENGLIVFTSSSRRQDSIEDDRWKNGAFTKALIEGLSGKADINSNHVITITELDYYLSERVKKLTKGRQTPTTAKLTTMQDFPIAIK